MAIYRGPGGAGDATNDASSQAILALEAAERAEAAAASAEYYSTLSSGAVVLAANSFTGNGSTTAFTLSSTPISENNLIVDIDGVMQETSAYSVSGTTLTFSEAPYNGASIEARVIANTSNINTATADNVIYTPSNSGSTTRSVENKLREIVSVKDFGAVGDGVTDDTAAFLAAAATGSTASRFTIYVPEGTYKLTAPWVITNRGVSILGAGKRQSVLRFYNCDGISHSGDYCLFISNIGFETSGNGSYTAISYGLTSPVYTNDTVQLSNVNIWGIVYNTNYWKTAIEIQDTSNTWFDRVTVVGNASVFPNYGGTGVKLTATIEKPSTGHHFTRCTFNFLEKGVEILATQHPSIEGVRFNLCGFVSVNNGVIYDAGTSGYKPPLFTFSESHIDLAANGTNPIGIKCNSLAQIDINGCDIYSYVNNSIGVSLSNCNQVIIANNYFVSGAYTNTSAILLSNLTTLTDISHNVFLGGFSNAIYVLGTALDWNRDIYNRFVNVVNEVLDGTSKFIRVGRSKVITKLISDQTIPNNSATSISWEATNDNFGNSWNVSNPTRLVISSGITNICISVAVRFAANSTGSRQAYLTKNGSFILGFPITTIPSSGSTEPTDICISSGNLDVSAGDYFEIKVMQTSGSSLNILNSVTYANVAINRAQ